MSKPWTFLLCAWFANLAFAAPSLANSPEAIGGYANGCVRGAQALPLSGAGYQVIRPSRERFYGHPRLIAYLQSLGAAVQAAGLGDLLIGDMAQVQGGPMPSGHSSHQTGLDADILFRATPAAALSWKQREALHPVSVLSADGLGVDAARWSARQEQMLQLAASSPQVARIFVNPRIKQALCASHAGQSWLGKLRPWWGHDGHFHVRLRCPPGDAACQNQSAIPEGTGCEELDWWFSPRSQQAASQRYGKPKKKAKPSLPQACQVLLAD